jgi:uncharacterized circularly permuted ATP-grasp superfamily protein/uncharacterized alpha-E superfamily protein
MPRLAAGYQALPGIYDELLQADGEMRPHYQSLMRELEALGRAELKVRNETGDRLIQEQGITYNVYGDPQGRERPWQLDPIPFLISAEEWRSLEKALIQRATLLNQILADCYGDQELVKAGRLPPALVFAQPDFLRPCHGIQPAQGLFLNLYAADLARSPDGQWWVTSDRTQIPTGAGYALENRIVTAQVLHEAFRNCRVQRVAGFFRTLQESLRMSAGRRSDAPRVVLFTPGPYNETYFEQAYLARYLGYTLVEGQDLAVRDGRVVLKTLSGLEAVDVILRRVDDEFCDPLELRNDSRLGVPGLVEAVRAGNVVVANALGSGLVQSPALMAFLPGLCRHLLGEELLLPSVATWWCGQSAAASYVKEHLEELSIQRAFRQYPGRPKEEGETDAETLARLIAFRPGLFVGQERVTFSTAPSWSGDRLAAGQISVRFYLVAGPDGYKVMPGGLARVATGGATPRISMQRGGASKDVWILSDQPVEEVTLLQAPDQPVELRRVGNNLPSRVADNFYWLGRYAERAEASARLLRSTLLRFNSENEGAESPLVMPLLQTLQQQGQMAPLDEIADPPRPNDAIEAELMAAIFDEKRPGSLRSVVARLQQITVLLRDRLSSDTWRVLSQLDHHLAVPTGGAVVRSGSGLGVLNQTILGLAAFEGLAMENMTRAQGWRFLDMGHRIERSIYLCSLLACALCSPAANNPSLLETLLEIADCSLTYRSRYNLLPQIAPVYDLVLLDDTNPRSLIFQLEQLAGHFNHLPGEKNRALPSAGQRLLLESLTRLRLADPTALGQGPETWRGAPIAEVIKQIGAALPKLSDAIAVSYFTHSVVTRPGARRGTS